MLQIVLLAGKFVFLIVLYVFIYRVIRSTNREFRASAASPSPSRFRAAPSSSVPVSAPAAAVGQVSAEGAAVMPGAVWALVVEKSSSLRPGEAYELPRGASALAGRAPETDIYLRDTFVSSKHALFESTAEGLTVEDLRSTNGTVVNGVEIAEARTLHAGDHVEVGDTIFRVEVR
jgi:biotin carboxyl carrier protein